MKIGYSGISFQRKGMTLIRLWPWHENGIDGRYFVPELLANFATVKEAVGSTHKNPPGTLQISGGSQ